LQRFLDKHPLHRLYGGENAFLLDEYKQAIQDAGLTLAHVLGHWESEINYFPDTLTDKKRVVSAILRRRLGNTLTDVIINERYVWGVPALNLLTKIATQRDHSAGRLYSFVATK
jgi:hypothetical protein